MPDTVFISHKDIDSSAAASVAERIQANGLTVYLDVIDGALSKDGPELADYLLGKMDRCQQLIAVVSRETQSSWWVPWEIGVGSEKSFRMASYATGAVSLPSYLQKWPVLRSLKDVDLYCRLSSNSSSTLSILEAAGIPSQRPTVRKSVAANFHRDLKTAISKGY